MLELISSSELATRMGYSGATGQFRTWLGQLNIQPVPGRRGFFDPALVRRRLDEAQGLTKSNDKSEGGLVAARRARNASQ